MKYKYILTSGWPVSAAVVCGPADWVEPHVEVEEPEVAGRHVSALQPQVQTSANILQDLGTIDGLKTCLSDHFN